MNLLGKAVVVKMYDGRQLKGTVSAVLDTVSGRKVVVCSGGFLVVKVDLDQVTVVRS